MNRIQNPWCNAARAIFVAVLIATAGACRPTDGLAVDPVSIQTKPIAIEIARFEKNTADGVEYSVWLGKPDGEVWYQHSADRVRPAASAIKTAILIEFFVAQIESLDHPFDAMNAILDNPDSPAIRHFNAEQKTDVQKELRGLTARQLAEAMIHKEHIESNAAYNAAANVIIEYLGGPAALTERVRQRFPAAPGLQIARYMLADRKENADNLLTAESLATVLRFLALHTPPDELRAATRNVLLLETDAERGDHYYKGGTLTSDPQVRIEAGFWDYRDAAFVYVVIATRPRAASSAEDFEQLRSNLSELSQIVQSAGIRLRDVAAPR